MSHKKFMFSAIASLVSLFAAAQPFAVLPDMPGLQKGVLPNGISYYVFQNKSAEGLADFVLVQKVGTSAEAAGEEGMALRTAKNALSRSERLGSRSPQEQMVLEGAIPKEYGFVKVDDRSTTFWFDDIPILGHAEKTDSALLVLFDIIDRQNSSEDPFVRRNFTPECQAIIISGDVDPAAVVGKMYMLSLMIPHAPVLEKEVEELQPMLPGSLREVTPALPVKGGVAETVEDPRPGVTSLTLAYDIERVPQEYMHTVYPAVTSKYIRKLGILAERRVRKLFDAEALPYVSVDAAYVGSTEQPGDECLSLTAVVARDRQLKALELMSAAFSSMSPGSIAPDEQAYAAGVFSENLRDWAVNPIVLNSVNVQRAISSFLYDAPLASPRKEMNFLLSKSIPDGEECKFVNNFARAVLTAPARLVQGHLPGNSPEECEAALAAGWKAGVEMPEDRWKIHPLPEQKTQVPLEKVKVRSTRPEPVTGGNIWIFQNGLRVVYKRMPVDKQVYASLIFNQGFASLDRLVSGEGALVNDVQKLYRVDGLSYDDYMDALQTHEVNVDCKVRNFNTSVDVRAPQDSLALVIRVLDDLTTKRSMDSTALSLYCQREPFYLLATEGTRQERIRKIDSIMCPASIYTPYRKSGVFSADLTGRCEKLFKDMSEHLNESLLVLVADKEPEVVKKELTALVGRFEVKRNLSRIPAVNFQPQAGSATYTVHGSPFSAEIAISARIPLTSENHVLAQVASLILEERMIRSLSSCGVRVEVSDAFRKVPQERFNVLISLSVADEHGFVEGTVDRNLVNVLNRVRAAVRDIPTKEEVERYLPVAKALLSSRHAHMKTYPDYHIATIRTRYMEGKDLFSKYESDLAAVDADKVIRIYSALSRGSSVEFVVDGVE